MPGGSEDPPYVPVPGPRIQVPRGSEDPPYVPPYWHGCNYPWSTDGTSVFYGLDFGGNIWGSHLGVSTRRDAVARDFADMASLGFTVVRWFVFTDGRAGIVFDDHGYPAGLDSFCLHDLDVALEIARDTGIALVLVLLDHRWMFSGISDAVADPATGALYEVSLPDGRANVVLTREGHDTLLTHVVQPVVSRYGAGGARPDLGSSILAFELMNEPDFIIEEWESEVSARVTRPVPFETFAALVSRFSTLVHARSSAMTTIGCARLHNLWAWDDDDLGLDVLQLHSYPDTRHPVRDRDVYGTPARALGVRRPVVLGEFPGDGRHQHPPGASPPPTTLDEYLEFAVAGGYAGAWPWSFSGTDAYGRVPRQALRRFAARYPVLVNRRALEPSED